MIYIILAALVILIDQLAKYFITLELSSGGQIGLIPGIIHLTYTENTGAAFSFLADRRWLLIVISVVVIIAAVVMIVRYRDKISPFGMTTLALVLGGAASHLLDRAVLGYVVDFFEVEFVTFAIFDVADCFITVGGILFLIYYIFYHDKFIQSKQTPSVAGTTGADEAEAAKTVDDNDQPETYDGNDPS